MKIKKIFYGQKAIKAAAAEKPAAGSEKAVSVFTGSISSGHGSGAGMILRYYRTVSYEHGNTYFGICIDAKSGRGSESYFACNICSGKKDAEELIRQLYAYSVSPSCAEECIDEILSHTRRCA